MRKPLYLLKGTIYRSQSNLEDLVEINEVFQDKDLLVAREKAFSKCQSYIDVFLESINKEYKSYELAIVELESFVNSYKKSYALNNPESVEFEIDFDKGLFIYLVTDSTDTYTTKEGVLIYNKKILVHSFDNQINQNWRYLCNGLIKEYEYFESNKFLKQMLNNGIKELFVTDFETRHILNSPIDIQSFIHANRPTIEDLLKSLEK